MESISSTEEDQRLQSLWSYQLIDNVDQGEFNDLVDLAAKICDTPISLISLLDSDTQYHKAIKGLTIDSIPRHHSFCNHTIKSGKKIMIVDDASKDERFMNNPLVTGDPNITFYAGVPLVNNSGHTMGALCVVDDKPRKLSKFQKQSLQTLSRQVIRLFELRKTRREMAHVQDILDTRRNTIRELSTVIATELTNYFDKIDDQANRLKKKSNGALNEEGLNLINSIKRESKTGTDYIKELYAYLQGKDDI